MDELGAVLEAEGGQLVLDEVLHRLDIVVGRLFDVLDRLGIGFARSPHRCRGVRSTCASVRAGSWGRPTACRAMRYSISTRTRYWMRPGFGEIGGERSGVAAVTAIDRADGVEGG